MCGTGLGTQGSGLSPGHPCDSTSPGEGDWGQVLMSTSTSSVFLPLGLPAHSSALPQPQGDPHVGDSLFTLQYGLKS